MRRGRGFVVPQSFPSCGRPFQHGHSWPENNTLAQSARHMGQPTKPLATQWVAGPFEILPKFTEKSPIARYVLAPCLGHSGTERPATVAQSMFPGRGYCFTASEDGIWSEIWGRSESIV